MHGPWLVSYVALWVVVVLLTLLLLGLARELGTLRLHLGPSGALVSDEGLDIGSKAADFVATEIPTGREISFHAANERSGLLVFISPNCPPCRNLLPGLAAGMSTWERWTTVRVICEGDGNQVKRLREYLHVDLPLLADPLSRIRDAYGQPPTPYAFLIGTDGTVALKGIVNTREDVERLLEHQGRLPYQHEAIARESRTPVIAGTTIGKEFPHGTVE